MGAQVHFLWCPSSDLSDDVFLRCRQFVVESAIRLGRRNSAYDAWNERQSFVGGAAKHHGDEACYGPDENGILAPHEDHDIASSAEESL
ncbi:hypothetical protein [Boudabousia marimammalium]|nr:hypothetical protein [Boudabousia marimammalium]